MFFRKKKEEVKPKLPDFPSVNGSQTPTMDTIDPPEEIQARKVSKVSPEASIENDIFEEHEKLGDNYNNPKLDDIENIDEEDLQEKTFQESMNPEEQALHEQELEIQRKREEIKLRRIEEERIKQEQMQQPQMTGNPENAFVQVQQALLNLDARVKEIEAILFRLLQSIK